MNEPVDQDPDFLTIPGLIAWVETDSDGTIINTHACRTGKQSEVVIVPIEGQRGTILVYDRRLSDDEWEKLEGMIRQLQRG